MGLHAPGVHVPPAAPGASGGLAAAGPYAQSVYAVAEQQQAGGERHKRRKARGRRDEDDGQADGAQQRLRERLQTQPGARHDDRADLDGGAGAGQRAPHRRGAVALAGGFFAQPADQQQAVVDAEPEAEAGDDVARVGGDLEHVPGEGEQAER
jgi:hypothetical protein